MLDLILKGLGLGLIISFSFGPAFWAVIQIGIDRGFKAGLFMSLGILISDFLFIVISYFGISTIYTEANKPFIGLVGGIMLIVFGCYGFFQKPQVLRRRSPKYRMRKDPSIYSLLVKGLFLNTLNPTILIFWLAAMGSVTANVDVNTHGFTTVVLVFFSSTLLTIFVSDLLKCYVGFQLKRFLRPRMVLWINKIVGVFLAIFGIVLIYQSFLKQYLV